MSFHRVVFALITFVSAASLAQDGSLRMSAPRSASPNAREGFFLAYQYSNLSLLGAKLTTEDSNGVKSENNITQNINGTLSGVSFGYKNLQPSEVGGEFAANYLASVNPSDSLNGMNAFQLVANLNYSVGPMFHLFAGANGTLPQFRDTNGVAVTPGIGGQVGVGLQGQGFYFTIGYNLLRFAKRTEITTLTGTATTTSQATYSGVSGQLGYIF